MLISAIIAEYNPFHNGHSYHIEKTRELGATHIVVIMSGNYTQRGTPAIADKRIRTEAALAGGADLVIELPLPYAMSAAQSFAFGAVSIAQALGCVDMLSFGSECGCVSKIEAASKAVDSPEVQVLIKELMTKAITYARARQQAVEEVFGSDVASVISNPNDSLAVEYLRQLRLLGSGIRPLVIKRHATDHHQTTESDNFASATLIRERMQSGSLKDVRHLIPTSSFKVLEKSYKQNKAPLDQEKFSSLLMPTLRKLSAEQIKNLPDISEGLENRIYGSIRQAVSVEQVHTLSKSKRYTAARIRRVVMAGFLGLQSGLGAKPPPYLRVLGFNARGREILALAKESATLPISGSLSNLSKVDKNCQVYANLEADSVDLYNLALPKILPCGYDFIANSVRLL